MAHVVHCPHPVNPFFFFLVQQIMVAWLDTVNDHHLHLIHAPSMLLVEVLTQTPHTSLAVLPMAVVAANKTSLVVGLANIPGVVHFTTGQIYDPAGLAVVVPPDGVLSSCHRVLKPVSLLDLLASYTILLMNYCAACCRLTGSLVCF